MAVQVDQAAKDLPRPPLQNLWVDVLVPLPVPTRHAQASATRGWQESGVSEQRRERAAEHSLAQCARREELRDKVDGHRLAV